MERFAEPIRDPGVLARVRLMFDLYEAAEEMMRQNLLRWFPEESEELIERRLRAWLRKDPGYNRTPFEATAPGGTRSHGFDSLE